MNNKVLILGALLLMVSVPSFARHNGEGPRAVTRNIQSEKIQINVPNQAWDKNRDAKPGMTKNQQEDGWEKIEQTPDNNKKDSRQVRRPFRHQGALNDR